MSGQQASLAKAPGDQETKKLFKDYVAMGTSIAAGFMSGGINDSTQMLAYPVILAARADAKKFDIPLLARPGCPQPWPAPLSPTASGCAGRANDVLPPQTNNVSVPSLRIDQAITAPTGSLGTMNTLMLGDNSELEAMLAAKPTFVSVELGDNDVFQSALSGVVGPLAAGLDSSLTKLASFQTSYAQIVTALQSVNQLRGAVLVGVLDPLFASPVLQPGAYFFLARDAAGRFNGKPVNLNCAPVNALGQPNPLATNLISFQILLSNLPEINCDPSSFAGAFVLDAAEQLVIHTRVQQFNAVIAAAAAANGWAYFDPNTIIAAALTTRVQNRTNLLRKCQDLATATTAAQLQAAVLNTCPVTGPTAAPNFFGSLISFDGVHPSSDGQILLANGIAAAINAKFGTNLATY
jgi:lysophospholipase L1-like esterase